MTGHPTLAKPEVVFFLGHCLWGGREMGRGRGGGWLFSQPTHRPTTRQKSDISITTASESLRDASSMPQKRPKPPQDTSKKPPMGHQHTRKYSIHRSVVSPSCFNSSFSCLHSFKGTRAGLKSLKHNVFFHDFLIFCICHFK